MKWKINPPFSLEPLSAQAMPGEQISFTASFLPLDASVFMATATCEVEDGPKYGVKVRVLCNEK